MARGWPVLTFERTVRLRQRLPSLAMPPRPALAAGAAVAAAACAAGLVWYASRRRMPQPVGARLTAV